jgi:hypothetical protein
MRVPVGQGDEVAPHVADRTGRCQESCQDVGDPIFMKRYRQWKKPSAGDGDEQRGEGIASSDTGAWTLKYLNRKSEPGVYESSIDIPGCRNQMMIGGRRN